jgi:hypothetical protein
LHEYRRVATIGGVLRLTESDLVESNSPALNTLARLLWQASFQAGHLFRQTPDGGTGELARLLTNDGCRNVQTHVCSLRYDAGTPEGERFADNVARVFRVGLPFVRTWATLPESYELLYQQMLLEMRQPDFVATLNVLTAWGQGAAWP